MKLKIAIPSKGRISEPSINLLKQAGLGLKDNTSRKLFSNTQHPDITIMFARAADIPEFVADGVVDMGITGLDLIKENNVDVEIVEDFSFGNASLVLAVPEDSNINSTTDIPEKTVVATEFPNLTKKFFEENNMDIKIVQMTGSTEIAPFIGIADVITDLSSTGTTLKLNHLKIIDTILDSSIKLICNKDSILEKSNLVGSVRTGIRAVLNAENKKLIMMNVNSSNLENIKSLIPGMSGPTISSILSDEDKIAIQVVINGSEVFSLVNKLKNEGANDILVIPIERIIQ